MGFKTNGNKEELQTMVKELANFHIIPYGTGHYKAAIALREEVLRKPLGLLFTKEELENERTHLHIVGIRENAVIATAVLVPQGMTCKMQRVVVKENLRGMEIGSRMMCFCEDIAQQKGFTSLYCHARDTAVSFYLKNGYMIEGGCFDEDTIPHVRMCKKLGTTNEKRKKN